jgi:UDP-2,3-diacylglucosamine pyrophosphatase LpxH
MKTSQNSLKGILTAVFILTMLVIPQAALAHCDTLDGPVVADARIALAQGEILPVLRWVSVENEEEIRKAFEHTMAVRGLNPEAQELADRYFFETLVRVHRAGEGAPYTGLKAAGNVEPVVAKADHALEHGSADKLISAINQHTQNGIHERFSHALETKKHAQESVTAGRESVEAYVSYVHYVEEIANVVHGEAHHSEEVSRTEHQH